MTLTLEKLVAAIRNGASVEELKQLVGPSEEEIEAAKARIKRIEALDKECEWDSMIPSHRSRQARERREAIVLQQTAFENAYC